MKITNVAVDRTSEHGDYCLAWKTTEGQFHVWLAPNGYEAKTAVGGNGRQLYKRPHEGDGVRYLHLSVPNNKRMFDAAMAEAKAGHLFEKCDEQIAQAEKERLAKAAAEYKVTLAKEAGPKMLRVLKAIDDFWSGGQTTYPLAPGAMIFNDSDELIADAVRAAIAEAEGRK